MSKDKKLPRGITVRQWDSNTETIYISFTYKGVRCREPKPGWLIDNSNIKRAARLRSEILTKIDNGTFLYADYFPNSNKIKLFGAARSKVTMQYYLDTYIRNCELRKVKPASLVSYKSRKTQLEPYVGPLPPALIDVAKVRDIAIALHTEQDLSYSSIRDIIKVLKSALDEAVIDKVIEVNPTDTFSLRKYISNHRSAKDKIEPFNRTELNKLITACRDQEEQLLISIWALTGLRTGELCALKWSSINLRKGTLKVVENYVSMVSELGTPKTRAGERSIELDEEALSFLKQLRKITKDEEHEHVFWNKNRQGSHWRSDSLRNMFTRLCKAAKVRYRYPYNLRHTYATINISKGKNLWRLAEQMGHTSVQMIYDTYGSYIAEFEETGTVFDGYGTLGTPTFE